MTSKREGSFSYKLPGLLIYLSIKSSRKKKKKKKIFDLQILMIYIESQLKAFGSNQIGSPLGCHILEVKTI